MSTQSRHVPITYKFPDFAGHLLDGGRFKLLDLLGSGAYGKVYSAIDLSSPCEKPNYYAVKCLLRPTPGSREEAFQLREFSLHRRVSCHPNIVGFHEIFYDHLYIYVVLDLCLGGDLYSAITERQVFWQNDELIKSTFVQILDAVHYCHEKDVFHRDLKPENILCSKDGSIYLADFGLSTHKKVSTEFRCGSSYYMSPECIGEEFGDRKYSTRHSDIWSLGVILTNMIAGRNPWRYAMTTEECFANFLHNRDFLRSVLPISSQANDLLKHIFHITPRNRITIPDLRRAVLAIDTFFMSEKELALSNDAVRSVAATYAGPRPTTTSSDAPKRPKTPFVEPIPSESAFGPLKEDPEDASLAEGLQPLPSHSHDALLAIGSKDITSSSSSVSDPESAGPITPESRPVYEPLVEVPELPTEQLGGKLSNFITFHAQPVSKTAGVHPPDRHRAPSNTATKPPPRRVGKQLFKKAVQRLKALSQSISSGSD